MAMPTDMPASMDDGTAMTKDATSAAMPMDMPCCPEKSSDPACGKDCPFMLLCMAKGFRNVVLADLIAPLTPMSILAPGNQPDLGSIAQAPPTRPPKI
jgi:hypothetical protein